jgi:hypothetical protein
MYYLSRNRATQLLKMRSRYQKDKMFEKISRPLTSEEIGERKKVMSETEYVHFKLRDYDR